MMRRLPQGEETLPIAEIDGELLTPVGLEKATPRMRLGVGKPPPTSLLIERKRQRINQGRVGPIYRMTYELTPEEQLRHMELQDEIGLELIDVERLLLEEEVKILRGDYGHS